MSRILAPLRRQRLSALLLLTTLFLCFSQPLQAQDAPSPQSASPLSGQLLQAVNDARSQVGLHPFQQHELLMAAAQMHADDMAANLLYSHTGSDGSSVAMRATRLGYVGEKGVSENWVSTRTVAGALAWWMNSYVHRNNLLNPKWNEIGIGVSRDPTNGLYLFVLVFGSNGQVVIPPAQAVAPVQAAEPVRAAAAPVVVAPPPGTPYIVQPGDTLLAIAVRYDLTWDAIAARNGFNEQTLLQVGQTITLPIERVAQSQSQSTVSQAVAPAIGGPSESVQGYTIRSGDTLAGIAGRYGLSWEELAAANGLSEDAILRIGQTVRIPTTTEATSVPNAAPVAQPEYYTVRAGDTVIGIAQRLGIPWEELLRINGLGEETVLAIDQQLRVK